MPSERQLAWHQMEFYGFMHITVNTVARKKWGYGDEPDSVFKSTDFSADQIARAAKTGRMSGIVSQSNNPLYR